MSVVPVILCGGSGSRLWPLSRELFPKQLLSLSGDLSLLQDTLKRVDGFAASPLLICNEEHRFLVARQIQELGIQDAVTLLEPMGRNTAPAVAVTALAAMAGGDPDPVLLVLPSDHVIRDVAGFRHAVQLGEELARSDFLVTFGVVPRLPETGYGYVRSGDPTGEGNSFKVREFVEKPDLQTAEGYLASGDYYWNSGMFMFRAAEYLRLLAEFQPKMSSACNNAYDQARRDLDFVRLDATSFANCPSDSIDYAVMEKANKVAVIPIDVGWSDVGSWSALQDIAEPDGNGNVVKGDVVMHDTKTSYIRAEHKMVATVGLDNMIVVETADAVLVASRDKVQDVKKIVEQLKASGRDETILHKRVYRPWGSYEGIDAGERHQVKRIRVNSGARLSLQSHVHRAEHWIVVRGTAEIVNGDKVLRLHENQSTYIPAGIRHRLGNPTDQDLEIIEVQTGDYLGEDDIERYEDDFGR